MRRSLDLIEMPAPVLNGEYHRKVAASIRRMVAEDRLPQTLLFAGPIGIGKATLARQVAAGINCAVGPGEPCGDCSACERILSADLSAPRYQALFAERSKLAAAKRNESPLMIAEYTDVLIFPPDGPMQTIGIAQALALRKAARLRASEGRQRIFIIEHAERTTPEAANALLKTLEEPASGLTIILTSENPYLLLPTIRSRAVPFFFPALTPDEMTTFFARRQDIPAEVREQAATWSRGSPGLALSLDIEEFQVRREAMLALVRTSLSRGEFARLVAEVERVARKRTEGIEELAAMLSSILRDLLRLHLKVNQNLTHADIGSELAKLASRVSFQWIERAITALDELEEMGQRNIQKQIALEAYALGLQG